MNANVTDEVVRQPDFIRAALEAVPLPVFVINEQMGILDFNAAASALVGTDKSRTYRRHGGEILYCIHSVAVKDGCGHAESCKDCAVSQSFHAAIEGHKTDRRKANLDLIVDFHVKPTQVMMTTKPFTYEGKHYALLILEDIGELLALRNMLPICANCKKIRNDDEYWQSVDSYFRTALNVEFTHGICPECARQMYAQFEAIAKPQE